MGTKAVAQLVQWVSDTTHYYSVFPGFTVIAMEVETSHASTCIQLVDCVGLLEPENFVL